MKKPLHIPNEVLKAILYGNDKKLQYQPLYIVQDEAGDMTEQDWKRLASWNRGKRSLKERDERVKKQVGIARAISILAAFGSALPYFVSQAVA